MLRRDSPLLVRPGLDPAVWSWLISFARHCNRRDFQAGLEAVAAMAASSTRRFRELESAGVEFEIHRQGLLFLFLTRKAAFEEMAALVRMEALGCQPAQWIEAEQLRGLEPAADGVPMLGILAPDDEHVRPETLTAGLATWLRKAGVDLVPNTAVEHIRVTDGRASVAVSSSGEEITADAFVLAAGVESRALGRELGALIPLIGGKGYSITYTGSAPALSHPLYLAEARVAISPYRDGVRVLGTMELGTRSEAIDRGRVEAMVRACARYLPRLRLTGEATPWAGMRPMVPDGLPVIGPAAGAANAVVATGHAMLGITLAPATGELVADILEGRELPPFAAAFSPDRFGALALR
jgi:D-amino-acid dehydrogenase